MCIKHLYDRYFHENTFLFKVVCLIEVRPKFMEGKTTKYILPAYAFLAVHLDK